MPDLPVTLSRGAFASLKAEALLMLLLGCTIKPLQATRMVAKAEADVRMVISSTTYNLCNYDWYVFLAIFGCCVCWILDHKIWRLLLQQLFIITYAVQSCPRQTLRDFEVKIWHANAENKMQSSESKVLDLVRFSDQRKGFSFFADSVSYYMEYPSQPQV